MKQRAITAFLIIGAVIPVFFSIHYLYVVLFVVSTIAAIELNDLVNKERVIMLIVFTTILILSIGMDFIAGSDKLNVSILFLLVIVFLSLIYSDIGFSNLSLIYTVSLLIGFAINAFIYLYKTDGMLVWLVLLLTYGSDTGAYLIGSRFGKTKLIPKISPNKTVEGAVGGVVIGATLGIIFGMLALTQYLRPINIVFVSLVMPIIAQLGDLFFSSLKRSYDKKDFGTIFPGHGGVLDRIDSVIFSLVFMIIFIRLGYLGVFL